FPTQQTGSVVSFDAPHIYGKPSTPITGNITQDLTGARIGITQKIYHQDSTAPTFPGEWVNVGYRGYNLSNVNIIQAEYVSAGRVEYNYGRSVIVAPEGLVSHWRFDGNVLDSAGYNDGTIHGDPQFVQGVSGQALSFDGVDDYVRVYNSTVNIDTTKEFSVSAWVKATDNGGDHSVLTLLGGNQSRFDLTNGPTYIYRDDSGSYHTRRLPGATLDDQWHHVVWVISNSVFYGYVDGVLVGQANIPNPSTGSFGTLDFAKAAGSSENLNGLIDEARIYNRALSEQEIQN